jgi:hypothetical protein
MNSLRIKLRAGLAIDSIDTPRFCGHYKVIAGARVSKVMTEEPGVLVTRPVKCPDWQTLIFPGLSIMDASLKISVPSSPKGYSARQVYTCSVDRS